MARWIKLTIAVALVVAVLWVCVSPVLNLAPTANRAWKNALLVVSMLATLASILAAFLCEVQAGAVPRLRAWQPVDPVDLNCTRLC